MYGTVEAQEAIVSVLDEAVGPKHLMEAFISILNDFRNIEKTATQIFSKHTGEVFHLYMRSFRSLAKLLILLLISLQKAVFLAANSFWENKKSQLCSKRDGFG